MRACSFLFLVSASHASGSEQSSVADVVDTLREMLTTSQTEGKEEHTQYAKFKCWCDKEGETKNTDLETAIKTISESSTKIDGLRAKNGALSIEKAQAEQDLADTKDALDRAKTLRDSQQKDWEAQDAALEAYAGQLASAIETLVAIGGDQTLAAADHDEYMAKDKTAEAKKFLKSSRAKATLVKVADELGVALRDAESFLPRAAGKLRSFLQAPGSYAAQSGEIVGILNQMKDTFADNRVAAKDANDQAIKVYKDFKKTKGDLQKKLEESVSTKESSLGDNTGEITSLAGTLETATTDRDTLTENIRDISKLCNEKAETFETRKQIRAQEQAAVSQAISILNSDEAFDTFKAVSAKKDAPTSFLQTFGTSSAVRRQVLQRLKTAATRLRSYRLARLALSLRKGNPFTVVVKEISKMIALVDTEQEQDETNKAWCEKETSDNEAMEEEKKGSIETLEGSISKNGVSIEEAEGTLKSTSENIDGMKEELLQASADRLEDHRAYLKEVVDLNKAHKILTDAIGKLEKFYSWLSRRNSFSGFEDHVGKDSSGGNYKRLSSGDLEDLKAACEKDPNCVAAFKFAKSPGGWLKKQVQEPSEFYDSPGTLVVKTFTSLLQEPSDATAGAPEIFDNKYEGQKGGDVIGLLETIKGEQNTERQTITTEEEDLQVTFEELLADTTADLNRAKEKVDELLKTIMTIKKKNADLLAEKRLTEDALVSVQRYLAKIKPGCDFIKDNFELRSTSRTDEKTQLEAAKTALENTPMYGMHERLEDKAKLGECADACYDGDVKREPGFAPCEACKAGVTVKAFCTANKDATGCDKTSAQMYSD